MESYTFHHKSYHIPTPKSHPYIMPFVVFFCWETQRLICGVLGRYSSHTEGATVAFFLIACVPHLGSRLWRAIGVPTRGGGYDPLYRALEGQIVQKHEVYKGFRCYCGNIKNTRNIRDPGMCLRNCHVISRNSQNALICMVAVPDDSDAMLAAFSTAPHTFPVYI